jgi:hypothetical protein
MLANAFSSARSATATAYLAPTANASVYRATVAYASASSNTVCDCIDNAIQTGRRTITRDLFVGCNPYSTNRSLTVSITVGCSRKKFQILS